MSQEEENAQRQQLEAELRLLPERQRRMYDETITAFIRLRKKKLLIEMMK